jgi:hypothetical protein
MQKKEEVILKKFDSAGKSYATDYGNEGKKTTCKLSLTLREETGYP